MAASLVGGAAVGAAFGELLKAFLEMKDKALMFKPTLEYLTNTLDSTTRVIKEIEEHNNELGRPKEELEYLIRKMEEGTKLVYKSSKISKLNFPARIRHQEQLAELVESLVRFFIVNMQAQISRDLKETLLELRRIRSAVNKRSRSFVRTGSYSDSASASEQVDLNQIEMHDSLATQPADENAMETNSTEQAIDHPERLSLGADADQDHVNELEALESKSTQPDIEEAGTSSLQQVMEESLLVGAAVGAVFGELLKAVLDVKDRAFMFKPTLAFLTRTLKAIDPLIKEIEQHNDNLGRPKEELESLIRDMEEGTKLVYKCSKISRINIYGRIQYQEELVALAASMESFFKTDVQTQIARDLKETLSKVRRIHSPVNKRPFLGPASSSSNNSAAEAVDLGQIGIHEPTDENAMVETISIEEAVDSDTLRSTSCKDADGTTSAEQVMEDINSFSQKTKAKAESSQATTEQLEPPSVFCIACGTSIRQNATLNTSGLANTSYSYCNQCYNERIPGKITAYEGCPYDLEDLLSASAEVLRKTSYGTTYKVMLKKNGTTLVMKRLKDVVMEKKEFERQIKMVQKRSQHPNVMPLLAWYYSKHEKLLIYDYMPAGSLCRLLHSTTGDVSELSPGWTPLDFGTRMKILLGAAKGIAHIHSVMGGKFVHGNINSCNVLVTDDFQGRISDFCLTCSVSESFNCFEKEGYQAPEIELTQKSDVYNFGIILLEMLTRRWPSRDLPSWVEYEAVDGLLDTLFDREIHGNKDAGYMMQLARECVARKPDSRPSMSEVVMRMEASGKEKNNIMTLCY